MTLVEIFCGLAINWVSSYSENTFKNAFEQPYIQQLRRVLNNTIKDFEEKYPQKSDKCLFYRSQIFYEACLECNYYEELNITAIHKTIVQDKKIAPCTEGEVESFIDHLLRNIYKDKALKDTSIQAKYQHLDILTAINRLTDAVNQKQNSLTVKGDHNVVLQNIEGVQSLIISLQKANSHEIFQSQDKTIFLEKAQENSEEEYFWNKTLSQDSIGGYQEYLYKYPKGKYSDKAVEKITQIENRRKNAKKRKDKKDAEKQVEEARIREHHQIEEDYWLSCEYKQMPMLYIDKFPNGKFVKNAFNLKTKLEGIEINKKIVYAKKVKELRILEDVQKNSLIIKKNIEREKKLLLAEPEMVFIGKGTLKREYLYEEWVEKDEKTSFFKKLFHKVEKQKISRIGIQQLEISSFSIGKYPTTQLQWKTLMGNNPSHFKGDDLPVEKVDWEDCQEFIKRLNELTGKNYRLPSDREWEFAAKGGNYSKSYEFSGSNNANEVAWYENNSNIKTQPVRTKKPNELGIYDMSGNVCEWCYLYEDANKRLYCGGSWNDSIQDCRISHHRSHIMSRTYDKGFRLLLPI